MYLFLMPLSLNSVSIDCFMLSVYPSRETEESLYRVVICVDNMYYSSHALFSKGIQQA